MRILATPDISPLFVRYLFDGSFNFCASICIQKLLSQQIDPRKAKHASMSLLLCPLICSTSAFPFHPAPGMFSAPQQILLAAADEAITPSQMQFYIFMLFGAGPFAPGFAALSQSRKDFDAFGTLSGGPTLGGPSLNLTPLQAAVLPELLCVADVNQCIQVCPAASNLPTPKLVNPQATCSGLPCSSANMFRSQPSHRSLSTNSAVTRSLSSVCSKPCREGRPSSYPWPWSTPSWRFTGAVRIRW